jgi:hypothetical protein
MSQVEVLLHAALVVLELQVEATEAHLRLEMLDPDLPWLREILVSLNLL